MPPTVPAANIPQPEPAAVASSSSGWRSIASARCQPPRKCSPAGFCDTASASLSPAIPVVGRLTPAVGSSAYSGSGAGCAARSADSRSARSAAAIDSLG